MEVTGKLIDSELFENRKRHLQRRKHIEEKSKEIPKSYKYDIEIFVNFCAETKQEENVDSMLDFLYYSLTEQRVKKSTWEKRLAAVKKYLFVTYDIDFSNDPDVQYELSMMRKMYNEEKNAELVLKKGKSPVDKEELLNIIRNLPTRPKAICLVNLITANRPSDMVRLKIKDFDLENNTVYVYMKKQKKWHAKRLTQEAVKAVKDYIKEYNLKPDDYFVGRVFKNGKFKSVEASLSGYNYMLNKWIGLTGYNLRKTQVTAMHIAGADLPTIAKQTGHQSLEVISKHYLDVSDATIDKYL